MFELLQNSINDSQEHLRWHSGNTSFQNTPVQLTHSMQLPQQTNKQRSWSFKNFFDDMKLLKALNQQRHSNHFKMRDCLHFLKCVDIDTVLTILKGWNIQIFVFWCWLDLLVRLEYRGQLGADWKCSRNRDQPLLHFGSLTREACLYRP